MSNPINTASGFGILFSMISRLGEDMRNGSVESARLLANLAHDVSGVPKDMVHGVSIHSDEMAEGFSIKLIDRRRIVILLGAHVKPNNVILPGRLSVGESSAYSDKFVGFIEYECEEHDVFKGQSPKFMDERSLVTGKLPDVLASIRKFF